MKILKIELIQPGITPNEPIAVLGVFPSTVENLTKVVKAFLEKEDVTNDAFNTYVKDQLISYINSCEPVVIKKEDDYITIVLKTTNDSNS